MCVGVHINASQWKGGAIMSLFCCLLLLCLHIEAIGRRRLNKVLLVLLVLNAVVWILSTMAPHEGTCMVDGGARGGPHCCCFWLISLIYHTQIRVTVLLTSPEGGVDVP